MNAENTPTDAELDPDLDADLEAAPAADSPGPQAARGWDFAHPEVAGEDLPEETPLLRTAVVLPDFTGRTANEVADLAETYAWQLEVTPLRPTDRHQRAADGLVLSQSPAPGHHQLPGSVLALTVVDRYAKKSSSRGLVAFLSILLAVAVLGLAYGAVIYTAAGEMKTTLTAERDAARAATEAAITAADAAQAQAEAEISRLKAVQEEAAAALEAALADSEVSSSEIADLLADLEEAHAQLALARSELALLDGSATALPDLSGLSRQEVEMAAADHGWDLTVIEPPAGSDSSESALAPVVDFSPAAGTPMIEGSALVITLGEPPASEN